jgi:hypothetical protein
MLEPVSLPGAIWEPRSCVTQEEVNKRTLEGVSALGLFAHDVENQVEELGALGAIYHEMPSLYCAGTRCSAVVRLSIYVGCRHCSVAWAAACGGRGAPWRGRAVCAVSTTAFFGKTGAWLESRSGTGSNRGWEVTADGKETWEATADRRQRQG